MNKPPLLSINEGQGSAEESWLASIRDFLKTSISHRATLKAVGQHLDSVQMSNHTNVKVADDQRHVDVTSSSLSQSSPPDKDEEDCTACLTMLDAIKRKYGGLRTFCKQCYGSEQKNRFNNTCIDVVCVQLGNGGGSSNARRLKKDKNRPGRNKCYFLQLRRPEDDEIDTETATTATNTCACTCMDRDDNQLRIDADHVVGGRNRDSPSPTASAGAADQQQELMQPAAESNTDDDTHESQYLSSSTLSLADQHNASSCTVRVTVEDCRDVVCDNATTTVATSCTTVDEATASTSTSIDQHDGVDLAVTMNLRMLIGDFIFHSDDGWVTGRAIGNMLRSNSAMLDAESTALDELKKFYGNVWRFIQSDSDIFTTIMGGHSRKNFTVRFLDEACLG